MSKAKNKRQFTVYTHVALEVSVDVEAPTMEEALKKAREMTVDDFISVNEDVQVNDTEMRVTQIYDPQSNLAGIQRTD